MNTYCYINGEIKPLSEAAIGVTDLGLQRGYAVFDFVRTYNNRLFHFDEHLVRFRRSASGLNLKVPLADEKIRQVADVLLTKSDLRRPALRLILTGGYSGNKPLLQHANFIMIAEELPLYDDRIYTHGARLVTVEFQREMPDIKTTNYVQSILLEPLKKEKQAIDVLYHSGKRISECPRSSFFVFRDNILVTPKDLTLAGITRKLVLQLGSALYTVREREITVDELHQVDEAFITSTTKGIVPIVGIDDFDIGSGTVGSCTRAVMQQFEEYTSSYGRDS